MVVAQEEEEEAGEKLDPTIEICKRKEREKDQSQTKKNEGEGEGRKVGRRIMMQTYHKENFTCEGYYLCIDRNRRNHDLDSRLSVVKDPQIFSS